MSQKCTLFSDFPPWIPTSYLNDSFGPCSSVAGRGGKVHLQLGGGQFAQQWVNGSFLPVVIEFQTQHPNGLLLYTHSPSSQVGCRPLSV